MAKDGSYTSILKEQAILKRLSDDPAFLNVHASWHDKAYFYILTVSILRVSKVPSYGWLTSS